MNIQRSKFSTEYNFHPRPLRVAKIPELVVWPNDPENGRKIGLAVPAQRPPGSLGMRISRLIAGRAEFQEQRKRENKEEDENVASSDMEGGINHRCREVERILSPMG